MEQYDCIVIGSGAMGLASQYHLSNNKIRTLSFEQFSLGHAKGSTHGQTRALQYGYYDKPFYIPFLKSAQEQWHTLERLSGLSILKCSGKLEVHDRRNVDIPKITSVAKKYDIPIEIIDDSTRLSTRFKQFNFNANQIGLFEPYSGFLDLDAAQKAFLSQIDDEFCHRKVNETVLDWEVKNKKIILRTNKGHYQSKYLIITPGSWHEIIKYKLENIKLIQKVLCWFNITTKFTLEELKSMPVFAFNMGLDFFYGFPPYENQIKIARHTGGKIIENPENLGLEPSTEEIKAIIEFSNKILNNIELTPEDVKYCLYTQTADTDFIIDKHPDYDNVVFATGFSGHGYKFAPAVGQILVDLLLERKNHVLLNEFSLKRV